MDWVRINNVLPDCPKVLQLADELGVHRDAALGLMVRWLCWLDAHSADGCTGLPVAAVERWVLGVQGAVGGLLVIGWAEVDADGLVRALDWERFNAPSAKVRAMTARRVQRCRGRKKGGV